MKRLGLSLVIALVVVGAVVCTLRSVRDKGAANDIIDVVGQARDTQPSTLNLPDVADVSLENSLSGELDITAPQKRVVGNQAGATSDTSKVPPENDAATSIRQVATTSPKTTRRASPSSQPSQAQSAKQVYLSESSRVAGIGVGLARNVVEQLYDYLKLPVDSNQDLDSVQMNSVKNDIMDKLLAQKTLPSDLGATLVELFENRSNDELLRNYVVQHFELFLQQKVARGEFSVTAPEVVAIRNAYALALEESHNSLAGVALLGMERATKLDAGIDRDLVARKAALYAGDSSADVRTRIAAVQVCGVMKEASAKSTLRNLINDPGSIPLQLAAIHSLGELGDSSDVDRLNDIASSGSRFARAAANKAAAKISARHAR